MDIGNQMIADVKDVAVEGVANRDHCPLCGRANTHFFLKAPDRFHLRREDHALWRCDSCGGVWLDAPPRPEDMGRHYSEDYHRVIAEAGETNTEQRWGGHRKVIERYKSGGSILDIGCSTGGFLSTMRGGHWKLHGIEIAAATAEKARASTGADIFVGDVLQAPFAPGSFDVITCFDLLEHVYQPPQFIAQVREWLKPGGILFTRLPNIDSWEARLFQSYWYGLELPRHLFHFSPRSLRNVMREKGFQELSVATPPVTYVELSCRYVHGEILETMGFHPESASKAATPGIPWKVVRKALRLSIVAPFGYLASMACAGGCIEAVFAKPIESAHGSPSSIPSVHDSSGQ
jgi:2-polyprenyl-3-methyl-5-hydroxy-6-metoxy-1,4-benzoquinol methylase